MNNNMIKNGLNGSKQHSFKSSGLALLALFLMITASSLVYAVEFERLWGTDTTSNGHFKTPMGVAVDSSGNVYVADTWNHRIQKFDSDGGFLAKWGSEGSGEGQFSHFSPGRAGGLPKCQLLKTGD